MEIIYLLENKLKKGFVSTSCGYDNPDGHESYFVLNFQKLTLQRDELCFSDGSLLEYLNNFLCMLIFVRKCKDKN